MTLDLATAVLPGAALHRHLAELRERDPVARVRFGGQPAWLLTRHADVEAAFRDEQTFPAGENYRRSIEPLQGPTFESMDGPPHRLYRNLTTPAFRSRAVDRFEADGIVTLAHELADRVEHAGSPVDLVEEFTGRYPFLVITRLLGIPREAEDDFRHWATRILRYNRDRPAAERAAAEFRSYLAPVLTERRRSPRDDVISELTTAEVDGTRLTDAELVSHVIALFTAGTTTTSDGTGNLLFALLTHPDALDEVRATPDARPAGIEELLRWESPVSILPRIAPAGARIAGVTVPEEGRVLFGLAAANRDPTMFDAPDRFDPRRDTTRALTFGLGTHSCPGFHLARREMRVALDVLLDRFPALRLCDADDATPRGAIQRGPQRLVVEW